MSSGSSSLMSSSISEVVRSASRRSSSMSRKFGGSGMDFRARYGSRQKAATGRWSTDPSSSQRM